MPEHIDLSDERPGGRADVHALTEKTGIKIQVSAGRIITGEASLTHEGSGDAPVALGLAKFGRSVAASLPVGMLIVVGWLHPMPGWLLGILAVIVFITVYAGGGALTKPAVKSRWLPWARSNGHHPNGVPTGQDDTTKTTPKTTTKTTTKTTPNRRRSPTRKP